MPQARALLKFLNYSRERAPEWILRPRVCPIGTPFTKTILRTTETTAMRVMSGSVRKLVPVYSSGFRKNFRKTKT